MQLVSHLPACSQRFSLRLISSPLRSSPPSPPYSPSRHPPTHHSGIPSLPHLSTPCPSPQPHSPPPAPHTPHHSPSPSPLPCHHSSLSPSTTSSCSLKPLLLPLPYPKPLPFHTAHSLLQPSTQHPSKLPLPPPPFHTAPYPSTFTPAHTPPQSPPLHDVSSSLSLARLPPHLPCTPPYPPLHLPLPWTPSIMPIQTFVSGRDSNQGLSVSFLLLSSVALLIQLFYL